MESYNQVRGAIEAYGQEARTYQRFSREEQIRLGKIMSGDVTGNETKEEAREKLITSSLSYALSYAKQAWRKHGKPYGMDLEGFVDAAVTGLIYGVDKYQGKKGFCVLTIARYSIRREITEHIAANRYPMRLSGKNNRLLEEIRSLERNGYMDDRSMAARLGISPKLTRDLRTTLQHTGTCTSLPEEEEDGTRRYAPDPRQESEELMREVVFERDKRMGEQWLRTLPLREQDIIKCRIGFDGEKNTLEQMGKTYKITGERIRQIQAKATRKLRKHAENNPTIREWVQEKGYG